MATQSSDKEETDLESLMQHLSEDKKAPKGRKEELLEDPFPLAKILKSASSLLVVLILSLACVAAFISRLFAVIRFESIIHEFDPWFNYRATHYMVNKGFYNFLNWFDERAWYPLGRIVGGTVYPGLMLTSGLIHYILNSLHITIHIRDVCVFLAPIFSGLTAIAMFLMTREVWSTGAGLLAAACMSIVPGYISRSVAGSYDNEGIAIFALLFTYFLWLRSVKTGSVFWATSCAISYFYMVSAWGGYVFIINLIPLHTFVLILMGRFSVRLYVAYTTFFILGLIMSMQVPFVGFQPIRTSEHMAAAGVFALINAYAFLDYVRGLVTKREFTLLFYFMVLVCAGVVFLAVLVLTWSGYVAPWSGRFYSLWDTGYAKIHIPIIASVSEHQPTTWASFFFDLHILICVFPSGIWIVLRKITDERIFLVLYGVFAAYFAGVMVRLMLTFTPIVCCLGAIAISQTLTQNFSSEEAKDTEHSNKPKPVAKTRQKGANRDKREDTTPEELDTHDDYLNSGTKNFVVMAIALILMLFTVHCTWVTSNAYSSPSIVLATQGSDGSRMILDDFREAYFWLSQNTAEDATVMSWWDYGYQIAGMGNRTTLVDNNTWNNSHIALVGMAMSSPEERAYKIMRKLGVNYVLAIFGGFIGYSGDDINKFLWMVRIAQGEHPSVIKESDYFTQNGEFRVDSEGAPTLLNCLMYKMCYYRFGEIQFDSRNPSGFDRTRNVEIGNKDISFKHLEEAYTTEHWLVRIYKVKDPSNRIVDDDAKITFRNKKTKYSPSTKKYGKRKGIVPDKLKVTKGKSYKQLTGKKVRQ
ncbi:Dolichyl-diphosphooligosaccharide--protein glycosyltransferase subunit STT3B [Oopsacas minuta]|uniref:dolichyl-diphosphooligosaccharide--protein glycotransferase n=1 Tax=Oopsacas minuta TaxID=111878 RepID=A0AAV7J9R9_9METZ|nr:Dolichyl-diphosphooligosaccharide--protein glycosyltransferase subunit STT3B [Oopsacas minuta]